MTDELTKIMRSSSREHFYQIWKTVKNGNLDALDGEEKRLGEVMLEREDQYHNQFEIADFLGDHEFDVDSEEDPFMHVTIHAVVENQLEAGDPVEVYQFYNAMRKKKVSRHDTIHLIGSILLPLIVIALRRTVEPDMDMYCKLLRKYKGKNPEKIPDALDGDLDPLFEK